jgi:predicted nucleic acid-binding protein
LILVDTPIWSLALRRRPHDLSAAEAQHVEEWKRLVRTGGAHLIGPIRHELLSDVREDRAWERLGTALRPFPDLPITTSDSERAAQFFNRCRAKGIVASAIDLVICAVSAGYGVPIYTTDADFGRYSTVLQLRLHTPRPKARNSE